jgi:CubicO group peptidase (beta-lactamase class C family)
MKPRDSIDLQTAKSGQGISPERLLVLRDRIGEDIRDGIIPGAVVLIARHRQLQFFEAFGFRDRDNRLAMTCDAIFCQASITKLFTSVVAMTLVEQGKLRLDQPVSRYLPKFRDLKVSVETPGEHGTVTQNLVPAAREMTIHDLMRHTSGLTYGDFGNSLVHREYVKTKVFDWDQTNAEMVERLAALPLACQPGSTFEYGMSTDVLGHIAEIISGLPLDAFLRERVCEPLGLDDTKFCVDDKDLPRLALPAAAPDGLDESEMNLARPQNSRWLSGGGGLFSTAADVYRLMQMLLNGGQLGETRILSPKTIALMTADHLPPNVAYGPYIDALQMTAPTPEMGQGFGLGFAVRTAQGRNPLPGSLGEYYWAGVSGTYAWADPIENLVGVLMLRAPHQRVRYRALIRQLVYQALA